MGHGKITTHWLKVGSSPKLKSKVACFYVFFWMKHLANTAITTITNLPPWTPPGSEAQHHLVASANLMEEMDSITSVSAILNDLCCIKCSLPGWPVSYVILWLGRWQSLRLGLDGNCRNFWTNLMGRPSGIDASWTSWRLARKKMAQAIPGPTL